MGHKRKLLPHQKWALLRELAEGKATQKELAAKYGIDQSWVSRCASENADRIAEIRANVEDEFAGMWIAQKRGRVEMYLEIAEQWHDEDPGVAQKSLRAVAEELGQLPPRGITIGGEAALRYQVDGVDPKDLK